MDLSRMKSMEEFEENGLDLTLRLGCSISRHPSPPPPDPHPVILFQFLQPFFQQQQSSHTILPSPFSSPHPLQEQPFFDQQQSSSHIPLPTPFPSSDSPFFTNLSTPFPSSDSPFFTNLSTSLADQSNSPDSSTAADVAAHRPATRTRRNHTQAQHAVNEETIVPSFPWATDHRATVHTLEYLLAQGIVFIEGDVQCRRCEIRDRISFDLKSSFNQLASFIVQRMHLMHDRAPPEWLNPVYTQCGACAQPNCMRPVIADKKRKINWLFLLLGQTLGCCTLEQLKYFCKHTMNHRTGAKDRVLYITYITLCKQLDPAGPFFINDS